MPTLFTSGSRLVWVKPAIQVGKPLKLADRRDGRTGRRSRSLSGNSGAWIHRSARRGLRLEQLETLGPRKPAGTGPQANPGTGSQLPPALKVNTLPTLDSQQDVRQPRVSAGEPGDVRQDRGDHLAEYFMTS